MTPRASRRGDPPPELRILFDEAAIAARVEGLADEIRRALPTDEPLLLGLLTGGFVFVADLSRALSRRGVRPRIELAIVSHYGRSTIADGNVEIIEDLGVDPAGEAVLVVDDVLDSGHSLDVVTSRLRARAPAWLATCVLLDKRAGRRVPVTADFVGFEAPDEWLVGYGLDLDGRYRELPHVAAVAR